MHDRILEMIEHEVRRRVAEQTAANLPEEWDLETASTSRSSPGASSSRPTVIPEQINRLKRDALADAIAEAAREKYEEKERQVDRGGGRASRPRARRLLTCASSSARCSCR